MIVAGGIFMWKRFFATLCACLIALVTMGALRVQTLFPLSALAGERTYYLDCASSQAVIKKELSLRDIFRVKGQSVKLAETVTAEEIATRYRATLVDTERVGETVCYYYHIEGKTGVRVNGQTVNLHIAVTDTQTVVGAPFIFGSF